MYWATVAMMLIIIFCASKQSELVFVGNYTNVTQALTDWSAKSWIDFTFAQETCPSGYKAIKNTW